MSEWNETLVPGAFAFLVVYAILADLSALRVPNWIPLALAALFIAYAAPMQNPHGFAVHTLVGGVVLAATFALFALGVMGGGDAKLISALALWMGPAHLGPFLLLLALLGGLTALALLGLRQLLLLDQPLESRPALAWPAEWARAGKLPYALPIGIAALIVGPELFAHSPGQ